MNKKFFMAALAGLLTVCGLTATAADDDEGVLTSKKAVRILAVAKPEYKLSDKLAQAKTAVEGKTLGYIVNPGTDAAKFVTLGVAAEAVSTSFKGDDIAALGHFAQGDKVQFGYKDENGFTPAQITVLSSDSGYSTGYDVEGFYQLDFSAMPFDGTIEVLVVGEPLPDTAVTLIVALGLVAAFMGYNYRKQRAHAVQRT